MAHSYTEGIRDIAAIIELFNKNADSYSIDKNNIFFVGGYIGGSIAAVVVTISTYRQIGEYKISPFISWRDKSGSAL